MSLRPAFKLFNPYVHSIAQIMYKVFKSYFQRLTFLMSQSESAAETSGPLLSQFPLPYAVLLNADGVCSTSKSTIWHFEPSPWTPSLCACWTCSIRICMERKSGSSMKPLVSRRLAHHKYQSVMYSGTLLLRKPSYNKAILLVPALYICAFVPRCINEPDTVEPLYNEDLGTMKIYYIIRFLFISG